jgi:hypothetical protein
MMEQVGLRNTGIFLVLHLPFPEERLYWILNHSYQHGKPRQPVMRPSEKAEVRAQFTVSNKFLKFTG